MPNVRLLQNPKWSAHTAKRHRLLRIKAGWMAVEKATLRNKRKVEVYYLGKAEVEASGLRPKEAKKPVKKIEMVFDPT